MTRDDPALRSPSLSVPRERSAKLGCLLWRAPGGAALASVLLAIQPSCALSGAGLGYLVGEAVPGPYERRSLAEAGHPAPGEVAQVARGDRMRLVLASGAVVEGRYQRVRGPTPSDPETYIVVEQGASGRRAAPPGQEKVALRAKLVPASDVRSIEVEVTGSGWLIGAAIGVAVDAAILYFAATTSKGAT